MHCSVQVKIANEEKTAEVRVQIPAPLMKLYGPVGMRWMSPPPFRLNAMNETSLGVLFTVMSTCGSGQKGLLLG